MRHTRRWLIPVMALAMLVGAAAPVAAKPESRPPKESPVVVDVTMTLVNGEGLTTDCDDGDGIYGDDGDGIDGSIEMIKDGSTLRPASDPVLGVYMNEVRWERFYADPIYGSSGFGFWGCHRMLLDLDPNEPEARLGGLMISLDETGAVTDLLWHFDYWYVWGTRGKKVFLEDYDQFTLYADETTLVWVDNTPGITGDTNGTLTAQFGMAYHHVGEDYQPLPNSPRTMSFTFEAVPRG